MSKEITRLHASCSTENVASELRQVGAVVIEGIVPDDLRLRVLAELQGELEKTQTGNDGFMGTNTRRVRALAAKSDGFIECMMNPIIKGGAEACICVNNSAIQLHFSTLVAVGPGESAQKLHRDQWAWDFHHFRSGKEVLVNTMWAMTDFTAENGATLVVPGSHLLGDVREVSEQEAVAAEMPAGSVMLFTGSTFHGAGANNSQEERIGMIIGYAANWLRQEENQYLAVPTKRARELPEEVQKLLGYDQLYSLGFVEHYASPREWLMSSSERD